MPQDDPRFAGGATRRAGARLRDGWNGTVARRLALRGPVPDSFSFKPAELDIGSPEQAAAMLRGQFTLGGATARVERGDPWRTDAPGTAWLSALHSFGWLRHFRASDNAAARNAARKFTDGWLNAHGKKGGIGWQPPVCGTRVVAWCQSADLLTENAEPVYRSSVFRMLAAQARYLQKAGPAERVPTDRLRAALGVAYVGLCVRGAESHLAPGLGQVVEAAGAALLSDGGAVSRNPSDLLFVGEALLQLRENMKDAGEGGLSAKLTPFIEKTMPMIRMLRMDNGGFALFHGGRAESAARINRVLVESGDVKPAPEDAPKSGYIRLTAGGVSAILDAGAPPEGIYARRSHGGPLALALSSGGQPIIVNCGSGTHLAPEWEGPCRASAAHSTLTVAERSPCVFDGKPDTRYRKLTQAPRIVDRQSQRDDSGVWAMAAHDGYAVRYGLIHYRRVFLDAEGMDFRGEDTLTLAKGGARVLERSRARRKSPDGPHFAIRFHLHPDVTATIANNKARLVLPDGEEWQMLQSGGKISLEDSIHIPSATAPATSRQVVITSALRDTEGQVRWALKRVDGPSPTDNEEET